jgi:hypothetical protein
MQIQAEGQRLKAEGEYKIQPNNEERKYRPKAKGVRLKANTKYR